MCANHFSHWSSLWLPAGVPLCQDLCWLWACGHGWGRQETLKNCKVFWAKCQHRNWKWNLQVKVNLTGHISAQKLWLSPLTTRAGWGRGGWVTSSLVPSRSYLPFPFGSCPNRCPSLWTNTISAARQSRPGSSQTPQTWSTSSDRRSLRTCSRWSKVWEPSQQPLAWFFGYGAQISSF